MSEQNIYNPPVEPVTPQRGNGMGIASLVLGILGLCAWFIPLCGFPVSIVGLILGFLGINSTGKGMAIAGLILSGICLLLSLINAIAGAVLGLGGNFNWQQFLPR
ncbi:MAG TPA: DUF4190 domain-containing protein [Anaerolineaceae bacterium]